MSSGKQTYKYIKNNSIIDAGMDEYRLTQDEYYRIYSFFVTYSMCGTQSAKKRSFVSYGWENNRTSATPLGRTLVSVLDFENAAFVFTDEDDLLARFTDNDLNDGVLVNVDDERGVIGKTNEDNKYLKLFYRIRDGFAHGKYSLRKSSSGEKMVVIQDDDSHNVTARIVLKLSTILSFISAIDIGGII